MSKIIQYRFIIIVAVLLIATAAVNSPFSYRHYKYPPYLSYILIISTNCLLYLSIFSKFIIAEKVFYAFLISCLALIFGTLINEVILVSIHGLDSNFETISSPAIVENIAFYFISQIFAFGIFGIWLKYRRWNYY